MPRKPRQFEVGGIYHVMNRGIEKRKIFVKDQDYSRFILGLEFFNSEAYNDLWELIAKGGSIPPSHRIGAMRKKSRKQIVELLAFALMPNHYHFILREIREGGISLFMRKMGGYSTYFNKQYDRVGPLFPTYKAVAIRDNRQLHNVFVYVHTNPVELKEPAWKDFEVKNARNAISWLQSYRWSSYHDYTHGNNAIFPLVTQRDFFLEFYDGSAGCRQSIEDWITFKEKTAQLGEEILE